MRKWVAVAVAIVALVAVGGLWWWKSVYKYSGIQVIKVNDAYAARGQVLKWFPNVDSLDVKVGTKTISLKLREYPQMTAIGPNPKDRANTTNLVKSQYTKEEWGRAFCEGDVLLIGTKDNVWKNVTNYMQITPDFVNVEDRPCYNLPTK